VDSAVTRGVKLQDKILTHKPLREFLTVREGLVSGKDEVFILDSQCVPAGEEAVYVPFLSDRAMVRFHVPQETSQVVFYPYIDNEQLTEEMLQRQFKRTWEYLQHHREVLSRRPSVIREIFPWWRPERPRLPAHLLRPKIVSPHLIVMPRFR